jgi:hypothetical protein
MIGAMRALVLVLLVGCGNANSGDAVAFKPTAQQFAQLLVSRDFAAAYAMVAPEQRNALSQAQLQAQFEQMVQPIGQLSGTVTVTETMTDWPAKKPGDAGWAYVAITGADGSEAVTVVITKTNFVRSIEWGRP